MSPTEVLQVGCQILDPVLQAHGFSRLSVKSGRSSGGNFASTEYVRGDRRLELHFRYSLGLVTYQIGGNVLSHEDYMRMEAGDRGDNEYPGFSRDPLDGFRHLRHDLERYASRFLSGPDSGFLDVLARAAAQPKPTGFKALSRHNAV